MSPFSRGLRTRYAVGAETPLVVAVLWTLFVAWGAVGMVQRLTADLVVDRPAVWLALALATLTLLPDLLLILWVDRHEREPPAVLGASLAWGAFGAVGLALVFNEMGQGVVSRGVFVGWWAPVVEELAKCIGLAWIVALFRREVDGMLDVMVYGALIGLAFAWAENVEYLSRLSAEDWPEMVALAGVRGLMEGLSGHPTFTALAAAGIGWALRHPTDRAARPAIAVGILCSVTAHVAWNSLVGHVVALDFGGWELVIAVFALQVPFSVLVAIMIRLEWRHEEALIRRYLASEAADVCATDELRRLVPAQRRASWEMRCLRARGVRCWWTTHRRAQAQVELAFALWHLDRDPRAPWGPDEDAEVARWRARVKKWTRVDQRRRAR